jgi:hypothetical protein
VKLRNNYLTGLAAIAAVFFVLMGCTHIHTMKKDDISVLQTGSPLKGVAPKTFAFKEFRDARGKGMDPYLVLQLDSYNLWKLEQPATAFVAMAIRRELERNGHTCITYSEQSKSDFIVEGSVYKYWILYDPGLVLVKFHANIGAKITVSPASAENRVLTKTYEGDATTRRLPGERWKTILNQALLMMLKEFSTDPDLVAFLEK